MNHDEPDLPDGPLTSAYRRQMSAVPPPDPVRTRASIETALRVYDEQRAHEPSVVIPMRARWSRAVAGAAASVLLIAGAMVVVLSRSGGGDSEVSSPAMEAIEAEAAMGDSRGFAASDAADTDSGDTGTTAAAPDEPIAMTDADDPNEQVAEAEAEMEANPAETTQAAPSDPRVLGAPTAVTLESETDLLAFADGGGVPGAVVPPCAPAGAMAVGPAVYGGVEVVVVTVSGDDGDEVTALDPDTCSVVAGVIRSPAD